MRTKARGVRRRTSFSAVAAENSALKTRVDVCYNLLVTCRDWLRIMGADLGKISRIEGALGSLRKST